MNMASSIREPVDAVLRVKHHCCSTALLAPPALALARQVPRITRLHRVDPALSEPLGVQECLYAAAETNFKYLKMAAYPPYRSPRGLDRPL